MKIKVINLLSAKLVIVGLGTVPAAGTESFKAEADDLQGSPSGLSLKVFDELRRLETAGSIEWECQLESGDVGLVACKKLEVSFADGDFDAAALAQTFTSPEAFPTGARLLGGRLSVIDLITNSDADHASSTALPFVTGPTKLVAAVDCDSVTPDTAGDTAFTAGGIDLGGKYLNLTVTNTGAGANQALNTAGHILVEVLYTVAR